MLLNYSKTRLKNLKIKRGFVAQLVEQLTLNQLVEGSSPSKPSLLPKGSLYFIMANALYKFLL